MDHPHSGRRIVWRLAKTRVYTWSAIMYGRNYEVMIKLHGT